MGVVFARQTIQLTVYLDLVKNFPLFPYRSSKGTHFYQSNRVLLRMHFAWLCNWEEQGTSMIFNIPYLGEASRFLFEISTKRKAVSPYCPAVEKCPSIRCRAKQQWKIDLPVVTISLYLR